MRLASRLLQASLFVDTSAFYALADQSDRLHSSAKGFLESNTSLLITSNLVVHETITLIRMRLGHAAAVQFGRSLFDEALTPVLRVTPSEERRAWDLFQRYHDKRFSFVDCTSFTLMQRRRIPAAFAFDRDFRRFGHWIVYPTDADV